MTVPGTRFARSLRRRQTDVEVKLWAKLRNRQLDGLKFRRQVPKGPYVVDFLCDEAMLIVELDGSQHAEPHNEVKDAARTAYLESLGYHVMRLWNNAVNRDLRQVLDGIFFAANPRRKAPSTGLRPPSPQGEKDKFTEIESSQ